MNTMKRAHKPKGDETPRQVTERVLDSFKLPEEEASNVRMHAAHRREAFRAAVRALALMLDERDFKACSAAIKRCREEPNYTARVELVDTTTEHMVTDYVETLAGSRAESIRVRAQLEREGLSEKDDRYWIRWAEIERTTS